MLEHATRTNFMLSFHASYDRDRAGDMKRDGDY